MKNKVLTLSILIATVACAGTFFYFGSRRNLRTELAVQPMGDDKGIFIGDKQKKLNDPRNSAVEYTKEIKTDDDAWENVRAGDSYSSAGRHEEAAQAYEKAYAIGGMTKGFSGLKLARTYEKLGRYDAGITVINEMLEKHFIVGNLGIQDANELKAKLLSEKNQPSIP